MKLGSCVWRVSTGIVSATSAPPETRAESSGRRRTRLSTAFQSRDSFWERVPMNGIRPRFTRSPSFESSAGRIESEPIRATATMIIAPTAIEVKMALPVKSIPAIAIITVRPEMRIAWPDVPAAVRSASRWPAPRLRSSRSRRT